ncbi:MAG TPA: efflux RND transporter permease subunit [Alphaproteobacteria bacterium]|nr:efflux RND transporter permease subunit [Alphaproteobacteria bacterium]
MRWIISLCVRRAGSIAVLTLIALALGLWAALRAPLDVFPDFVPSEVTIQTEAPGFTSQQVEELVTRPIESAVNGATGVDTMRSESTPGLSVVTVTFAEHLNVYNARQGISELLSEVSSELPFGVGPPKLSPLVSSTMDLLKIGLVSDKLDAYQLRDIADWVLKPRLLAVPGVAHVIVFGGAVRQIQIQPDLQRLASYGFTLTDLADAGRAAMALRGGGFIDLKNQRVLLNSPTPSPDVKALSEAVLTVRDGTPIHIGDVANVVEAPALQFGDSMIMGRPGVLLSLASQYGANTLSTTHALESALKDVLPALKEAGVTVYPALHRPANFIERALGNLERALIIAAILILIVLYAFLRDIKSALIAFLAIPLSLFAAIAALDAMGQTLNTMTLGGFAVALGVLVDDAIIGIENIIRRLRANSEAGNPVERTSVIIGSALEVRAPVVFATFVVIAVFLPEMFASNVQGRFVGPLAIAFTLAVLASLVVALTATPALCALFLDFGRAHEEAKWLTAIKERQATAMHFVNQNFRPFIIVLMILLVASLGLLPLLGGTFMPDFKEGHFVVQATSSIPGTGLDDMRAMGREVENKVMKLPYVQTIEQQIGRAELSEDTWGPHRSEFHVELKPDAKIDQSVAQEALRKIMDEVPGIQSEVVTFLGDRISESLTGETAQVAVQVYGEALDALDRVGAQIVSALSDVKGIVDLQFTRQSGTPTLDISLIPEALAASGLKQQDVLEAIQSVYAGATLGQTYVGTRKIDVVLLLSPDRRDRLDQISHLMITGPFGPVPLSAVARIIPTESRYSIRHAGGQRRVSVTFNVEGRSLQSAVNEAKAKIASSIKFPSGVYLEFAGAAEAENQARTQIMLYSALALILIGLILFVSFRWRAHTWLVMANLPFSLIGGIAAIALSGLTLTLGAIVGLVTVFGISSRNAILLLAHYEHLVEDEGLSWNLSTVLQGARERLIPILMTATVTALGLAPLAFGIHAAGQEIEGPMAVAVLGGLVSSTFLNLVLLPALAWRFGGPGRAAPRWLRAEA